MLYNVLYNVAITPDRLFTLLFVRDASQQTPRPYTAEHSPTGLLAAPASTTKFLTCAAPLSVVVLALQQTPSPPKAAEHSLASSLDAPALTESCKPCPAADAIFPKQLAKTALPPVSPVPGRSKRRQGYKHRLLTAAPACTLEIPKAKSEEEVWNAIRHVTLLQPLHYGSMLASVMRRPDTMQRMSL